MKTSLKTIKDIDLPIPQAVIHVDSYKNTPGDNVKLPYQTLEIKLRKPITYKTSVYLNEIEKIIVEEKQGDYIKLSLVGVVSEDYRPQEYQEEYPFVNHSIVNIVHVEGWNSDEPNIYTKLGGYEEEYAHEKFCGCNEIDCEIERGDLKLKNITLDESNKDMNKRVCPQVKSNVNFVLVVRSIVSSFHDNEYHRIKSKKNKKGKHGLSKISVYRPVKTKRIENSITKKTGNSSKHRYRYFVRGHYRVVKGVSIWIKAHERGVKHGLLINKDYIL